MNEFGRVCKKRKLIVNVEKSKVMKLSKNGDQKGLNISLDSRKWKRYIHIDIWELILRMMEGWKKK